MNIIPFEYGTREVQVIQDEHLSPWWIAGEVCSILDIRDTSQAIGRLDQDEKLMRTLYVSGQNRELWTVNEYGLYSLILRSNKPEAKKFKRWITHDVLPSIRKKGGYLSPKGSPIDLIIETAQYLKQVETKQIEHDHRLTELEAKSHKNSGHTGYWTITAWDRLHNLRLNRKQASHMGTKASRLSRKKCLDVGKVHDERYGFVNCYHEDILTEVFSNGDLL
jgi:prophage antirepressor-like protein